MLLELSVRDLGVIESLRLVFGPGMTALTGETGAGKTLVVEAIELLMGARADAVLVRPGAEEALIEGRFVTEGGGELVLCRAVPAHGRSRAYLNGRMCALATLAEIGEGLVDLHGQHAHQSLLGAAAQRESLDRFADVTERAEDLAQARQRVAELRATLAKLGGDARGRARELDLLRFQIGEIDAAAISDPDEDAALATEEDELADASAHREAAWAAYDAIHGDRGVSDTLGTTVTALAGRAPLDELATRLRQLAIDVADAGAEAREMAEHLAEDPERLAVVRARRQVLHELCRKYGANLEEVLAFRDDSVQRLEALEAYDQRAEQTEAQLAAAEAEVSRLAANLGNARRQAAPRLANAIAAHLRELAMTHARFAVQVGEIDPGDEVMFGLSANPGEPVLPLAKIASGGELARTMLAARLVLSVGPPTLVFDEVDAGIGGETAGVVGHALAALAGATGRPASGGRQVLVVTHLAQVAAFADAQIAVDKQITAGRSVASARVLDAEERIVELSRMLSGQPSSTSAREHAAELLSLAVQMRAEGAASRYPALAAELT